MTDGLLLDGTLSEYEAAFKAVDKSGNGTIGGCTGWQEELTAFAGRLRCECRSESVWVAQDRFVCKLIQAVHHRIPGRSDGAGAAVQEPDWPGNVV